MKIEKIPVGYLQANCYILNINNDIIIIDPGADYEFIKEKIVGNISAILITHHHEDHIGALEQFKNDYKCPIYSFYNLEEKKYHFNNFYFEVIYTPGHTVDCVTYYFYKEKIMFTGDFLFKGNIGRTDLETGNMEQMFSSLNKIKKYKNIDIYPGHGCITNLDEEKINNIYLGDYSE